MSAAFKKVKLEEIQHHADMVALGQGLNPRTTDLEEADEFTFGGERKKSYKDEIVFEASSSAIRTRIRLTLQTGPSCLAHARLTMILERGDEPRVCIRCWGLKNPQQLDMQHKLQHFADDMLSTLIGMVGGKV